jgi:hypothetical protein
MQKCAENANGVCASGGSFLIQLDSEELVERERERESEVGVGGGVAEERR